MVLLDIVNIIRKSDSYKTLESENQVELLFTKSSCCKVVFEAINSAFSDNEDIQIYDSSNEIISSPMDLSSLESNFSIKLYPKVNKYPFFFSLDEFLRKEYYKKYDQEYYILELDYHNTFDINTNLTIQIVNNVVKFYKILKTIANHQIDDKSVYFNSKSFDISPQTTSLVIAQLDNSSLELFIEEFEKRSNDEKSNILKNCLFEIVKDNKSSSISVLLQNIKLLKDNFISSYQMYLENFSFDSIKAELIKEHLDLSKKIQDTADSIWNKIIALPFGYVIAFNQFDTNNLWTKKNILIFIAIILTNLFISYILSNSIKGLETIRQPLTAFLNKHSKVTQITEIYKDLLSRIDRFQSDFCLFKILIWVILLGFSIITIYKPLFTSSLPLQLFY